MVTMEMELARRSRPGTGWPHLWWPPADRFELPPRALAPAPVFKRAEVVKGAVAHVQGVPRAAFHSADLWSSCGAPCGVVLASWAVCWRCQVYTCRYLWQMQLVSVTVVEPAIVQQRPVRRRIVDEQQVGPPANRIGDDARPQHGHCGRSL